MESVGIGSNPTPVCEGTSGPLQLTGLIPNPAPAGPQVGDRIAYVIVKGPKNAKTFEKAEDPIFVLENNLPIDAQHYLEHHLEKPLMRIFEPIMKARRGGWYCYDDTTMILR